MNFGAFSFAACWRLTGLLALACAVAASNVLGQDKPIRIGILSSGDLTERSTLEQALLLGLQSRGYIVGKNLTIERRYAGNDFRQVSGFARELADMKLDAIVTTCTPTTRIAKQATSSTPIVMAAVSDPVGQGLISSFAKPGGNVTGQSTQAEDLLGKRLALLIELVPKAATIAVLLNSRNPVHVLGWERLEEAAKQLKIKLLRFEVASMADIPVRIGAAAAARVQGLFVMPDDPLLYNKHALIVELAARHRLPDAYWASDYVDDGGLISYGQHLDDAYALAANYVYKIAKGASPADLPVQQPLAFELVINARTARKLGITIPDSLRLRADRVIE